MLLCASSQLHSTRLRLERWVYSRIAESAAPLVLVAYEALHVLADVAESGELGVRREDEDVGSLLARLGEVNRLLVVGDVPLAGSAFALD